MRLLEEGNNAFSSLLANFRGLCRKKVEHICVNISFCLHMILTDFYEYFTQISQLLIRIWCDAIKKDFAQMAETATKC